MSKKKKLLMAICALVLILGITACDAETAMEEDVETIDTVNQGMTNGVNEGMNDGTGDRMDTETP